MKSTFKIDINGSLEPVIVANISWIEDDLRDKTARKFVGSLYGHPVALGEDPQISKLCFVEMDHNGPENQIYSIYPIPYDQENKFINRLEPSQAHRIIPLAFQMFDGSERRKIIEMLTQLDSDLLKEEKPRY